MSELEKELAYYESQMITYRKTIKDMNDEIADLESWLENLRKERKNLKSQEVYSSLEENEKQQQLQEIEHKGKNIAKQLQEKKEEKSELSQKFQLLTSQYQQLLHAKNCILAEKINQES